MALGRRCELGCESWPDTEDFKECPQCGQPTRRMNKLTPLPVAEAHSQMQHIRFDEFYADHCKRLGYAVEGPLPEDVMCGD